MKAELFSCVIWKVVLRAHTGTRVLTGEEDDHYVFATALNTTFTPSLLFLSITYLPAGVFNVPRAEMRD